MAGADSQKHLLTFIRDFATEKSHGERRLDGLKKRIQDLQSELGAANVEHGDAKRSKETTEQELQGYEVELSLNESSIQALEARISAIQEEVSKIGYDLEALKNDEEISRDKFITEMFEFNKKIRQFQETNAHASHKEKCLEPSSDHGHILEDRQAMLDTGVALKGLEDELAHIISQTHMEEQQYQEEQTLHEKVQQEFVQSERQVFLMEEIVKEMKELEHITRQISELEESCASLGEELQRRFLCPGCHLDNAGALGGILQANERN